MLAYKINSFYKRAYRVAAAFYLDLKLNPGDRVAVLCENCHDFALIMHSCWIAKFVPVPLSLDFDDDVLVSLLNNCNVKTVVFEPAASARVATIYGRTYSVKEWLVTASAGKAPSGIKKLEDLLASALGEDLPDKAVSDEDCLGLIALTAGSAGAPKGVSFNQRQLLKAAMASQCFYPKNKENCLATSFLPLKSVHNITHSLLGSMFNDTTCLMEIDIDFRRFWDKVNASGVTDIQLSQDHLRDINRKGKPKSWSSPGEIRFYLTSNSPISSELLATFERRFGVKILPCYSMAEAGGVISCFSQDSKAAYINKWLYDYYIPASGSVMDGVEIKIVDSQGSEVGDEVLGEIIVRSDWVMQGYTGTAAGDAYFGQQSFLHTGDEGFAVSDENGVKHLFITGRISEMIQRNNLRINPAKIDSFLYEIAGVDYACAVGFPNTHTGLEVGAYVIPKRGSQLTKSEVKMRLRENLDWLEAPKVIIMGEPSNLQKNRPRSAFLTLFEDYKEIDFSVVQEG